MSWQPIDTAPKDGTPILCYRPEVGFSPETGIDVLWWDMGAWMYNAEPVISQPTHWMPLPAAPEATS